MALAEALRLRRSVREFGAEPLNLEDAAQLLWAAQGVTHPDGLRAAPSAGALYPLELYLVAGNLSGLVQGVFRYRPGPHALEPVQEGDCRGALARAALDQECVAEAPATLAFCGVTARTAVRYGGRSERYVLLEVGHAAENAALQAAALGLGSVMVGAFDDAEVRRLLGLAREEEPWLLVPVGRPR